MSRLLKVAAVLTLLGLGAAVVGPGGLGLLRGATVLAADGPVIDAQVAGPGLGRLGSPWLLLMLLAMLLLVRSTGQALVHGRDPRGFLPLAYVAAVLITLGASQLRGGFHLAKAMHFQGYLSDAASFEGPLDILASSSERFDELLPHTRTHPPGPLLVAAGIHAVARGVAAVSPTAGDFSSTAVLVTFLEGNLGGLLVVLIAWLWLWPLFFLVRRLVPDEPRAPVLAVALAAALANLHGIAPLFDGLHPLLVTCAALGLTSERRWAVLLGGFAGGLLLMMAYGSLVVGPLLLALLFGRSEGGRARLGRLALGAAGLLVIWALVALAGFDYLAGLVRALDHHAGGVNAGRSRGLYLIASPYTFSLWLGVPVVLGALAGTRSPEVWRLSLVLFVTLAVLVLLGITRGETERLWLPLAPFFVLLAAVGWSRTPRPRLEGVAAVGLTVLGAPLLAALTRLYA
ncbi:MAG: hypothetical protein P1V81_08305 [Planctomycetota bacterium]|nr:hypothetical protein [Planctomycetota bacterium]